MAILHQARLTPTKLELLAAWLPGRPWYEGTAAGLDRVASYRFDDPEGRVGVEGILVAAAGGPVYHVPLTYREAPLDGADAHLLGTAEHSALGKRWIYDACGDPVYAAALANAIVRGAGQAEQFLLVDGEPQRREPTMAIAATAARPGQALTVGAVKRVTADDPTLIETDAVTLTVIHRLDRDPAATAAALTGTWPGQSAPKPLAFAGTSGE